MQFGSTTVVPVSRKWLETMGVVITPPKAKVIEAQAVATATNPVAVAVESEANDTRAAVLAGVSETSFED